MTSIQHIANELIRLYGFTPVSALRACNISYFNGTLQDLNDLVQLKSVERRTIDGYVQ